jgi:poly(ADP-ribose) glycohydrolase
MHHRKWAKRTMLFVDALELDVADRRGGLPDVLPGNVERELRKAYTGFRASHVAHEGGPKEPFSVIYTGFWGCRTFGGNPDIKALIQWCAASLAGSPMKFICSTSEQHAFAAALRRFAEYASVTGVGANELLGILLDLTPGELEGQQHPMEHIRKLLRRDTR